MMQVIDGIPQGCRIFYWSQKVTSYVSRYSVLGQPRFGVVYCVHLQVGRDNMLLITSKRNFPCSKNDRDNLKHLQNSMANQQVRLS
jgi:hypothetical protein